MAPWGTDRRAFLKAMGLGAASLSAARPVVGNARDRRRPNILLYVVDDQGMGDAGCYGNPVIRTPALDALAKEGTRFTHGFCTTASCSASRSVILSGLYNHATGQYGHQHGYNHFVSFPSLRTLPVLLGEAGYRTTCAGKYHVAPEEVYHFDQYIKGGHPPHVADECRDFIADQDAGPFFLYFCTNEPHRPFRRAGSDPVDPKGVIVPPYLPDTPECREELAQYYMSVQRADSGLLRLVQLLKETGQWENTLVIFISDNGIAFPGAKTTVYEPGIRLPCVVRNPYQEKRGVVCDAMITWADLTPTILDFARAIPDDYAFHGRSFLPVLEEEHPDGWDEIYASHTFHEITMYYPMRVVRTRRHKLIWNIAHGLRYPFASDLQASKTWQGVLDRGDDMYGKRTVEAYLHRPEFELYDLEKDPHEAENVAARQEFSAVLDELKAKLRAFQERTKDPWVHKWDYE